MNVEAQLVIVLLLAGRVKAMGGHIAVPRVADDGVPAVEDPVRDETAVPLRPPPARGDVEVTCDLLHISSNHSMMIPCRVWSTEYVPVPITAAEAAYLVQELVAFVHERHVTEDRGALAALARGVLRRQHVQQPLHTHTLACLLSLLPS